MRYLWILLFVAGCASSLHSYNPLTNRFGSALRWQPENFPLQIEVDEEISPTRQIALEEAATYWNSRVGRNVFTITRVIPYFKYTQDEGVVFVSTWDLPDYGNPAHYTTLGQTFPDAHTNGDMRSAIVAIDVDVDDARARLVFEHELGHVLGLGHDAERDSIMFPYLNETLGNVEADDISFIRWEMTQHDNSQRNPPISEPSLEARRRACYYLW